MSDILLQTRNAARIERSDHKDDAPCYAAHHLEEAADEIERLRKAIAWALGYTDFRTRGDGEGPYWWRKELRERSKLSNCGLEAAAAAGDPDAQADLEILSSDSNAANKDCYYVFNGCAHPQFCKDGCAAKKHSSVKGSDTDG